MDLMVAPDEEQPVIDRDPSAKTDFEQIRWDVIDSKKVPASEKGAIIALLGSIERAEALMARVIAERASLDRDIAAMINGEPAELPAPVLAPAKVASAELP